MKSFAQRLVQAYQPLSQRGLLMDGSYKLPVTDTSAGSAQPPARKRMLLVALFGQWHPSSRSKS